jgi:hypothetical protein
VKPPTHRAGLPGNVDMIIGSALTPLRESVTALPAPAYRQEGGASSRLAREWLFGTPSVVAHAAVPAGRPVPFGYVLVSV